MENTVLVKKRLNPKLTRRRSTANTWPDEIPPISDTSDISGISGNCVASIESVTSSTLKMTGTHRRAEIFPVASDHGGPETRDLRANNEEVVYSALNVPMLLIWLNGHYDEAVTVLTGLEFVLHHAMQGEGCVLLLKHGVLKVLNKILGHKDFRDNESIQLKCIQIFKQLLECNYTRDPLITRTDVLKTTFAIGYRFMSSREVVKATVLCMLQCSRSEINRQEIMRSNYINYSINFCRFHSTECAILGTVLRTFCWVGNTEKRLEELCRLSTVEMALQCMKKHHSNASLLKPALNFLTRACIYSSSVDKILKKKAISMIIHSLRAVYDDEELQIEGLKMLQILSKTKEGYRQINETQGGWQSMCQGTMSGNALLHDLKGEFNNPGWCIGDCPVLTLLDERKKLSAEITEKSLSGLANNNWTSRLLLEFMGSSSTVRTLSTTVEKNEIYFELIKSLDLLPRVGEDKIGWFSRRGIFEKENELLIDDMVLAMIEIKKKDKMNDYSNGNNKKSDNKPNIGNGSALNDVFTPVFVNGIQVDLDLMGDSDVALDESNF